MNKLLKEITNLSYNSVKKEEISLSEEEFEKFKEMVINKIKPCINIESVESNSINLWDSKFGGNPYMLKTDKYPTDKDDIPMILIAQINYSQMPKLEMFPEKGMLQFFISPSEKYDYGLDWEEDAVKQNSWKLIYREEVLEDLNLIITDFSFLSFIEKYEYNPSPVNKEVKMKFEYSYSLPSYGNIFTEDIFDSFVDIDDYYYDIVNEFVKTYSHSIGGYNEFTQYDPREKTKTNYTINLLKIDSDNYMMWGDSGIGNLMISEEDLKNKNFNNVLYSWDCC